ncbi:MAG TPA: calcium/sodium antiporter [Ornithinimicrobium sp.]|uniref:calcium/sodium antiporter n=1 Tax=Ornithinimicrobium sp. TaxID=1977084 RepID=UPI002B491FE7|nr:calcium/sodium antiporter [Ornithinimicrobium sp.]HKJ11257.1 calcium/sodium antiporter [Ornithinimicrobium sp.]
MDLVSVLQVLGGLALLVAGGEVLVRGASALAVDVGISPLVVGLTVVSVATSAPELAVTTSAVFTGESDLALGNVVGSNIANILLILGVSAVVLPLAVRRQLVRVDVPFLIGFGLLLVLLTSDGDISTLDGGILLAVWVGHTLLSVWLSKRGDIPADAVEEEPPNVSAPVALVLVVVGVALLVGGSNLLVTGAVAIAGALGISSLVIGLTVVAIGTSLPELVASLAAVRKGETDLAVGNAIGSCLANIGLVLGVPALAKPGGLPVPAAAFSVDLPLMVAASAALLPVVYTGGRIARREGLLFVALYVSYTAYLVLDASGREAEEGFSLVMVVLVLPLVGVTLLVLAGRERAERRRRRQGHAASDSSSPASDRGSD